MASNPIEKSLQEVDWVFESCSLLDSVGHVAALRVVEQMPHEEQILFTQFRDSFETPDMASITEAPKRAIKRLWIIRRAIEFYSVCAHLLTFGRHPFHRENYPESMLKLLREAGWSEILDFVRWYEKQQVKPEKAE